MRIADLHRKQAQLSHQLPTPLAELCGNLERTGDGEAVLGFVQQRALTLFEATVRYTAAILIAAYKRSPVRETEAESAVSNLRKPNPSLGDWRDVVDKTASVIHDGKNRQYFETSVREVARAWLKNEHTEEAREYVEKVERCRREDVAFTRDHEATTPTDGKTQQAPQGGGGTDEIPAVTTSFARLIGRHRNEKSHDLAAWFVRHQRDLARPFARAILSFVRSLEWLVDLDWPLVHRRKRADGESYTDQRGDILISESPTWNVRIPANEPQLDSEDVVFDPEDAALSLQPFLQLIDCQSGDCGGPRVHFYSAWQVKKVAGPLYVHLACGVSHIPVAAGREAWDEMMAELPATAGRGELVATSSVEQEKIHTGRPFHLYVHVSNYREQPLVDAAIRVPIPEGVEPVGPTEISIGTIPSKKKKSAKFSFVKHDIGRVVFEAPVLRFLPPNGKPAEKPIPPPTRNNLAVSFDPLPELVGRKRELELLQDQLDAAVGGQARAVVLSGVSGVGKTALWRTFMDSIDPRDITVLEVKCDDMSLGEMGPVIGLLREYLWNHGDQEKAIETLESLTGRAIPRWPPSRVEITDLLYALAREFDIAIDLGIQPRRGEISGAETTIVGELTAGKDRLKLAIEDLFCELCSRGTSVFFIDNIHLMHIDTWDFFQHLSRQLARERVLLVVATQYRQGEAARNKLPIDAVHERLREVHTEWLSLEPLRHAEMARLFDLFLPGNTFSAEKKDKIIEFVRGLPMWLRETIEGLSRDNLIAWTPTEKWGDRIQDIEEVLRTFEDLIALKYRRLDPSLREILEIAAVLGRSFQVLSGGEDSDDVISKIDELKDVHHFWFDTGTVFHGKRVLEFSHDQVHETIYNLIDPDKRIELHARTARMLERKDAALSDILHHWRGARDQEKTLEYLECRAKSYYEDMSYSDAAGDYEEALRIRERHPKLRDEMWVYRKTRELAWCCWHAGETDEAIRLNKECYPLADRLNLRKDLCELSRRLSQQYMLKGDIGQAEFFAKQSVEDAFADEEGRWRSELQRGVILFRKRDYVKAKELFSACLDYAVKGRKAQIESEALRYLGIAEQVSGNEDQAERIFQKAMRRARESVADQNTRMRTSAQLRLEMSNLSRQRGRLSEAMAEVEQSHRYWQRLNDVHGMSLTTFNRARISMLTGNLKDALDQNAESLRLRRRIGDRDGVARSHELNGEIHYWAGDTDRCHESFEKAGARFERIDRLSSRDRVLIKRAQAFLHVRKMDEARTLLPTELPRNWKAGLSRAYQLTMARACRLENELERALAHLRQYGELEPSATGKRLDDLRWRIEFAETNLSMERPEEALATVEPVCENNGVSIHAFLEVQLRDIRARALYALDRVDDARDGLRRVLERRREIEDVPGEAETLVALASLALTHDTVEGARSLLEQALSIRHRIGDVAGIGIIRQLLVQCGVSPSKMPAAARV